MRAPLSERQIEKARRAPDQPAVPKDAATIIVVRDGDEGIEAFLMRRQTSMAFAAGMYVFPGGGMQPSDAAADMPWAGPDSQAWAMQLGCEESLARGLVVAAVRETFEETGVLLAGPDAHTVLTDTSSAEMQAARGALETGDLDFATFLRGHSLVLRSDLIGAWAHWITPAFEQRRYDTRFFVAALPAGQRVGAMSGEADRAGWVPLARAIASFEAGEAAMLPPTITVCREVVDRTADGIVAATKERAVKTVAPIVVEQDGEFFLETDLGEP